MVHKGFPTSLYFIRVSLDLPCVIWVRCTGNLLILVIFVFLLRKDGKLSLMVAGWSAGSQQPQVAKDQASMAGSLRADLNCSHPFVPTLSAMFRVAGPLGVLTPSLSRPIAGVEKDSSPQLP